MKCFHCGLIGHEAAQCRKNPCGWDAKRIVANKIRHCDRENGRQSGHKRGFQMVLFELSEVKELCVEVHFDDDTRVMFGYLLTDNYSHTPNDDQNPQDTDSSVQHQHDDLYDIFGSIILEANASSAPQNASSPETNSELFVAKMVAIYALKSSPS